MANSTLRLTLTLDGGPEASAEDLESLAYSLRDDLLELDVQAVDLARGEAPAGTRGGPAIDWTTILVTLAASGGVLTTVITAIQAWLVHRRSSSVTLKVDDDELVLTGGGPYSAEQKWAIELWLSRHKGYALPNE